MGKYYKGNIVRVNGLPDYNYYLNIIRIIPNFQESYHILNSTSHNALLYFKKYSSKDLEKLVEFIKKIITLDVNETEKQELDNKMKNIFIPTVDNISNESIIFEKIFDQDGNIYGKELVTGTVFPIKTKYTDFDVNYNIISSNSKIYYDLYNGEGYTLKEVRNGNSFSYYLIDYRGKEYQISDNTYSKVHFLYRTNIDSIFFDNRLHDMTVCEDPININICLTPKIIFSNSQRVEYFIGENTLANDLEVKNYLSRLENGLGRKRRKRQYENKINNYGFSNCLGDINFVSSNNIIKDRVNESTLTKEMQELEFLLLKLKSVSKEDYDSLNNEYLELLNQNDNLLHIKPLSLNSIISLQNRAELAFMCHGGESKKIIAYLEEQVNNYLNNYNSGLLEKTEISIKDLDKLSDYFLNGKNSYTIKEQNEILRCLALIYFFEMYENKDVLNSSDLQNSYIADNIKRILVVIDILHDEDIIKTIPNSLYDIKTVDELLYFIQGIEFNDVLENNGDKLIKKMQQ